MMETIIEPEQKRLNQKENHMLREIDLIKNSQNKAFNEY